MSLAFIFDLDDTLYKRLDTFTAAFADIFGDGSSLRDRTGEPVCCSAGACGGTGAAAAPDERAAHAGDGTSASPDDETAHAGGPGPLDMEKLFQDFTYFGYSVFEESMFGRMTMRDMYVYRLRKAMEQIGVDISDETALAFQDRYFYYQTHLTISPAISRMLDAIKSSGCILGLITNGKSDHQREKIYGMKLDRWFDEEYILASGDVGISKPNREIFLIAQERWGLIPEETWFIGDSLTHDVGGAASVGWHTIFMDKDNAAPSPDDPASPDTLSDVLQSLGYRVEEDELADAADDGSAADAADDGSAADAEDDGSAADAAASSEDIQKPVTPDLTARSEEELLQIIEKLLSRS